MFAKAFIIAGVFAAVTAGSALALPETPVNSIAFGEVEERVAAIYEVAASGDPLSGVFLEALRDGEVRSGPGGKVFIQKDWKILDAATGIEVQTPPEGLEDVVANNRLRSEISTALAGLNLLSESAETRLKAAKDIEENPNPALLAIIAKAASKETDSGVKKILTETEAVLKLSDTDPDSRIAALAILRKSASSRAKQAISPLLEKNGEEFVESDARVRQAATAAIESIDSSLRFGELAGNVFTGLSLASILLLAALGLAVTYGLMGVINMAHGELIMVGAYTTYLVQNFFRTNFPAYFDWYPVAAVPAAFLAAAIIGIAIERAVIRFLYGRPLETLLATWGISLVLIQAVRTFFGAQNVAVENPAWLSGGVEAMGNLVLPYSRIAIIGFSLFVLSLVWFLLSRTRLGLYVRAVTQNRRMASCLGVRTPRVDMMAFGLGSGVAGLAGVALSQIGNVGPALGQSYIVDSFLVVVLGGVGQLLGSVLAALGLGIAGKSLEAWSGAVMAKISLLAFIIIFIQRRPQGLFALKGRTQEN